MAASDAGSESRAAERPGSGPSRRAVVAGAGAVLAGGLLTGTARAAEPAAPAAAPAGGAAAVPDGAAPGTIPAITAFTAGPGAGWIPGDGLRIAVDPAHAALLRPEAERLAADLAAAGLTPTAPATSTGPTRLGDLLLTLDPGLGHAEGYRIDVRPGRPAVLAGGSAAGAYYAGRSLLQALRSAGSVPAGRIEDAPDRPERGIMVDIGRKFYTKDWLAALIRDLGWLKLNYLHLHFSENEGFRIESRRHPEITSAQHLTQDDIRELVALAAEHHVTVVPEIDMPGHLGQALAHHPDWVLRNKDGAGSGHCLDIANPDAVAFADDLIDEFLPLFPGPVWHLGGDEALNAEPAGDPDELYPHLVDYARGRAGENANAHDAFTLFINDRAARLRAAGKTCRGWNDGLGGLGVVRPDTRIEVDYWENLGGTLKHASEFLAEGHRVVNGHSRYFYYIVAAQAPSWYPHPDPQKIYQEWSLNRFEGQDPLPQDPPPAAVRGAHLSVWADHPDQEGEEQVAADLREPLRALAQRTWTDARPALPYAQFAELSTELGAAPH